MQDGSSWVVVYPRTLLNDFALPWISCWLQENDLDRSDEISMFAVTHSHKVV